MASDQEMLEIEITALRRSPVTMKAVQAIIPGAAGVFTVLPNHTPLLSRLDVGVVIAEDAAGNRHFLAVNGGMVEVNDNHILILTKTAESGTEIDVGRAEAARERAEERLASREDDVDVMRAELALKRALSRVEAHNRIAD